jgi:glycosyltransferase involved in cell wall biosynthesis
VPKFSFLIPSKNRLELLRHAVESVRRQQLQDYEIIVADNASEQDYGGYLKSIGDARILYRRSATPLPVTENWNQALALASGDYVLMLGDDDALAPGFGSMVLPLVETQDPPDIVYLAGYHYCYPQVMPGTPKGYLADVRNSRFLAGKTAPFQLPREEAVTVAEAAFGFRYLYGFNSQHFLFNARLLRDLAALGGIFQGPYPDTFAATVSFLKARSVTVVPEPVVVIGISPKSFGYYYFNDRADEGYEFLDNETLSPEVRASLEGVVLPGDRNNSNWLVAVEVARRALAAEFPLKVDVGRYRVLQMAAFLRDVFVKRIRHIDEIGGFESRLDAPEQAMFSRLRATVEGARSRRGAAKAFAAIERDLGQFWPAQVRMLDIGPHSSIIDAIDWLARNPDAGRATGGRRSLLQRLGLQ